jgi:hypothetical protein
MADGYIKEVGSRGPRAATITLFGFLAITSWFGVFLCLNILWKEIRRAQTISLKKRK